MRSTIKFSLAAAAAVGVAMVLREIARRQLRPSAISETLEHEDYEDYIPNFIALNEDVAELDDRVAPGAPL